MQSSLAHIDAWVFDLDNTLYPHAANLFASIDQRMTGFIQHLLGTGFGEARALQKQYFHQHGTTLSGLMADHGVDPHQFLSHVHDIEMDVLSEDRALVSAIARLPGRKLIFTNGDADYARRVLARLGMSESFEAIHDIHACAYTPKPQPAAYRAMTQALGIDPEKSLFVEDMARNLAPAKAIGMITVWLDNGSEQGPETHDPASVDYRITDLAAWLHEILGDEA